MAVLGGAEVKCFLCKRDVGENDDYVLWVLHDGRLVHVDGYCLDKLDRDEPYDTPLTYEETYTNA